MIMNSPRAPMGVWFDANGFHANLAAPEVRAFIRACGHVLDQMEGKNPLQQTNPDMPVGELHPGIKSYLDDLAKKK